MSQNRADAAGGPTFFHASSDSDAVVFGAAKSYEHFATLRLALTKYMKECGYLLGEPTVYVGLSGATEPVRNCDFGPLMQLLAEPSPRTPR